MTPEPKFDEYKDLSTDKTFSKQFGKEAVRFFTIIITTISTIAALVTIIDHFHPNGFTILSAVSPTNNPTSAIPTIYSPPTNTALSQPLTPAEIYNQVQSEKPIIVDPLSDGNENNWEQASGLCYFSNNHYYISQSSAGFRTQCRLLDRTFADFAMEVTITIDQGDIGGLTFYVSQDDSKNVGYRYTINANGSWSIVQASGTNPITLNSGSSPNFNSGYGQVNKLAVIVHSGSAFLYVNGTYIFAQPLNGENQGLLGFYAYDGSQPTLVHFNNAYIWQLP